MYPYARPLFSSSDSLTGNIINIFYCILDVWRLETKLAHLLEVLINAVVLSVLLSTSQVVFVSSANWAHEIKIESRLLSIRESV